MLKRLVVVSCLLCLGFVSAVQAEDEPIKKGYLALKGGLFQPNSKDDGLKGFDDGYNAEVALGVRFAKMIGMELGVGYMEAKGDGKAISKDAKVKTIPYTANLILTIPLGSALNLFAGGGIGYYTTKFSPGSSAEFKGIGYQGLGGIDFNLGQGFSIGAEYKYIEAKPEYKNSGITSKVKVGGSALDAGIKLRF
jgi:opacity protein-like surface antigen